MSQTADGRAALVLPALDRAARGRLAATLDTTSGLLTPARRTWRTRPVVADGRAHVWFAVRRRGVDLSLERYKGLRRATVPLVRVRRRYEASQSPELLLALADELERRGVRDVPHVVRRLRDQARWLEDGGDLRGSPLKALPRENVLLDLLSLPSP
ncbi:hypothetical protein GC089_17055 [Cellulomonas sp. JZ18]|uniref:hypothetical protein n=1 Tax=Cellulomonas sp. JZ18 TaxID=2654191 RepID=UPI0012D4B285|nr:hypothetical protein [Cellulomonas sp. JZ18]QGQ20583.1 hypothetical protein GC089_17055 [Cellulomonas sp. JZ18]